MRLGRWPSPVRWPGIDLDDLVTKRDLDPVMGKAPEGAGARRANRSGAERGQDIALIDRAANLTFGAQDAGDGSVDKAGAADTLDRPWLSGERGRRPGR